MKLKINAGSGQRPFGKGWINLDCQERWREASDKAGGEFMCCDMLPLPFPDGSAHVIVLWHVLEHTDMGVSDSVIKECHKVLEPQGRLILAVPDLRALAIRWLIRQLSDELYMINVYGPYAGSDDDRHKQGWTQASLLEYVARIATWKSVKEFGGWDDRPEGTDLNLDWWMASCEAIK